MEANLICGVFQNCLLPRDCDGLGFDWRDFNGNERASHAFLTFWTSFDASWLDDFWKTWFISTDQPKTSFRWLDLLSISSLIYLDLCCWYLLRTNMERSPIEIAWKHDFWISIARGWMVEEHVATWLVLQSKFWFLVYLNFPNFRFPSKNAKSVTFQTMTIPNHYMWLYKDKTILYMVKLTLRLSCAMNFIIYPHDTQECKLQMESCE
jgi:hypothetical protein